MFALVDCNNFYASCERLFRPELRNRPVAVLSNNDGCIIARSEEVKQLGIKMGAPYFKVKAELKRHNVTVFSSNYELYADVSARVMETLRQFSPDMEIYSIDECFLGLNGFEGVDLHAYGHQIRSTVLQWTRIPVGVGIGPTKTLAKVANKLSKQHEGVCILTDRQIIDTVLAQFPVEHIWGIGRRYARMLAGHGIHTAAKLCAKPDGWIRQHMTVIGLRTVQELRGVPCIELEEVAAPQKALAVTRSFSSPQTEWEPIREAIIHYVTRAGEKLRAKYLAAKHIQVFLHTSPHANAPYYSKTVQRSLSMHTSFTPELIAHGTAMLRPVYRPGLRYIKCGVILSDLVSQQSVTPDLFIDMAQITKRATLMQAVDAINLRYGKHTVAYAGSGVRKPWAMQRSCLSQNYTTRWEEMPVIRMM
jgi:DNA polymerase V